MAKRPNGRQTDEVIKNKYDTKVLESWSKLSCYKEDSYEFFLKYVLKIKPDKESESGYLVFGSYVHELLEKLYLGEINTNEEMLELWNNFYLEQAFMGVTFMTSDEEQNQKIGSKYNECIVHFLENYKKVSDDVKVEEVVVSKIGKYVFRGYIDFMFKERAEDGSLNLIIEDFKTSSKFTKDKIEKAKGQLILYAIGISQQYNISLDNIRVRWNMLKYTNIQCETLTHTWKTRQIERNMIGEKLQSQVGTWLKRSVLLNDMTEQEYLDKLLITNDINCLPEDVKCHFVVDNCYVEVECNDEVANIFIKDASDTLDEIYEKIDEYNETKDDTMFMWEVTKADEFRLNMIGQYTELWHKPLAVWKEKQEREAKLFADVSEGTDWAGELDDSFNSFFQ